MAVAFSSASSDVDTNVSGIDWPNVPPGAYSAVALSTMYWATGSNRTVSNMQYGGSNCTVAPNNPSAFTPSGNDAATVWGLANPPSGNQTANITFSGSGCYPTAGLCGVTGSDTSQCFSTGGGAGAVSTGSTTLAVTVPSATNELVYAHGGQDNAPTTVLTVSSPATERFGPLSSGDIRSKGATSAGAPTSVTVTITATISARWAMAGASFKEAGGAAAPLHRLMLMGVGI